MFARECFQHGIRGFEYKVGGTSDIRARARARERKEVIALNKEGFENVKVSTPPTAIQICAFEILNIHDPKRIFRIITRIRAPPAYALLLSRVPLDRLANVTSLSIIYTWRVTATRRNPKGSRFCTSIKRLTANAAPSSVAV